MADPAGVAVVTGGSSGIGEASAHRLARDGYRIAILDVNATAAEKVAAAIGNGAHAYTCDVADAAAVDATAAAIEKDMGAPHVLVTCAGLIPNAESILDMDMAAHDRMWQVNYNGTLHCCRSFARRMIPGKRGAIVTIGSINSAQPLPIPAYNMGKAAVARLTQLLAVELGRHNIRVNSVGPTYVMTPSALRILQLAAIEPFRGPAGPPLPAQAGRGIIATTHPHPPAPARPSGACARSRAPCL